jgi:DNA polymerase/3'-5' exonuclease PolX
MKGGSKTERRESAIVRRTKNFDEYITTKNKEKAIKAYRDIIRTTENLGKEIPQVYSDRLRSIGIDPTKITAKMHNKETKPLAELPEDVLGNVPQDGTGN